MIKIIVAVAKNRVIGNSGGIPWKLPADMKWFKRQTGTQPVVMGRKTYDSLPSRFRPLPGRENLVLTRSPKKVEKLPVTIIENFEEIVERSKEEDLWIIGGAEVYNLALPHASEMYLTRVNAEPKGNILFPVWDKEGWVLVSKEHHPKDEKNEYDFVWEVWKKI